MEKSYKTVYMFFILMSVLLYFLSLYNHLLFHTIIELFTVFIGVMIFIIALNSRIYIKRSALLIIGIAYLYIGGLDLMHAFTFEGVGIFEYSTNESNQYWIFARLLEALTLFVVISLPRINLKIKHWTIYLFYTLILIVAIWIIEMGTILPDFYILGEGQTIIKIIFEYIIIVILGITIVFVMKSELTKRFKIILSITLGLKMTSEILFTMYVGIYEFFTVFGHLAKFISYGGIYIIYVMESLNAPYTNIFHLYNTKEQELFHKAEIDQLTGLFNHSTTYNKVEEAINKIGNNYEKVTLMMLDIDDFKIINDTYGHIKGDEILNRIGTIFNVCEDYEKIVGRYGGDEFIILFPDCNKAETIKKGNKLRGALEKVSNEFGIKVTCSMGAVIWDEGDNATDLIRKADMKMYESKRREKGSLSIWEKEYSKRV